MKYFIYCRKSSEEEAKQIQSLETQERILTDFARIHQLDIVDIIKERKSAKTDGNRPLFSQMLKRIKHGDADGIIVIDPDRLTRNLIEGGYIVKLHEEGYLKEIRTRHVNYDSAESLNNLCSKIANATNYSRDLSIKVKDGNASKLLRGEYPSYAPIGYVNKEAKIYPDPLRSQYIQNAYTLYSSGSYSLKEVANILYEQGFRTRVQSKKVKKSVIHRILTDPIYYGAIRRKGQLYKGIHQSLIDKVTFDHIQDILSGKSNGKKQTHDFLYRTYLSCASCGCRLTASLKKGRFIYYYCTNGKGICNEHKKYLSQSDIKDLICELFGDFNLNREMADLSFEMYAQDLLSKNTYDTNTRNIIETQLKDITEKQNKLLDLLLDKKIPQERYDEKNKELENQKVQLELQLKSLKPQNPELTLERVRKVKEDACNLLEMFKGGDDIVKADLLKSMLWNFYIKEQKGASVKYKSPYCYLQNLNKTSDLSIWRRGWDSNPRRPFDLTSFQD